MIFKTLEVGSGEYPSGDVNIDRYVTPEERESCGFRTHITIPDYFVKADAHFLPFVDELFEKVVCSHTLEHLYSPYAVLKEIWRVLKRTGKVEIDVPNVQKITTEHRTHYYSWSVTSLQNLLRVSGFTIFSVTPEIRSLNMQVVGEKK